MARPQQRSSPYTEIMESGNLAFLYRPLPGLRQPQTSDEIEHAYIVLFPDEQQLHTNRVLTFMCGYFPPIIPNFTLPEEREWAYVSETSKDPRTTIQALIGALSGQTPPRLAGDGRYAILRHGARTYFTYVLSHPRQLGHAQQTLMMETEASFQVVVQEPAVPTDLRLTEKPAYPADLGNRFDGHVSIPLDPTTFLDYTWAQILLIGDQTDLKAQFGIDFQRDVMNEAGKDAFQALQSAADQIRATSHVDILRPAMDGALV